MGKKKLSIGYLHLPKKKKKKNQEKSKNQKKNRRILILGDYRTANTDSWSRQKLLFTSTLFMLFVRLYTHMLNTTIFFSFSYFFIYKYTYHLKDIESLNNNFSLYFSY